MNGMRWTTGIGIAVGGAGGALAALLGAPRTPALPPPVHANAKPAAASSLPPPMPERITLPITPASSGELPALSAVASSPSSSSAAASEAPLIAVTSAPSPSAPIAPIAAPSLELPTTRAALLKAELYCDQRKDFDECSRAAQAHETGTAGGADVVQAKRFRRIALTHLVGQCESGSPHACFVLAAKYRVGHELAKNLVSAAALEQRATELCRFRKAPECPLPQ